VQQLAGVRSFRVWSRSSRSVTSEDAVLPNHPANADLNAFTVVPYDEADELCLRFVGFAG
jgi:hypothetical protein